MMRLTLKKDGRKADQQFKKVVVGKMKEIGLSKNNKIIDYMWYDNADYAGIVERMIILNTDNNKYYEIGIEWGQSSYITETKNTVGY